MDIILTVLLAWALLRSYRTGQELMSRYYEREDNKPWFRKR